MTGYRPGTGSFIKAPQVSESAERSKQLHVAWGSVGAHYSC